MSNKAFVGEAGEELACKYLGSHGYGISFRNYRRKWGEIDIIARDPDGILVFVEVKSMVRLTTNNELKPEDNLTAATLKKLQ
jgi:putative endonuclease